jgi:hypothetical protein
MTVLYPTTHEAIEASVNMSLRKHPWLNVRKIDMERVIVRESLIVCELGLATRITTLYKDVSGMYTGHADCLCVE